MKKALPLPYKAKAITAEGKPTPTAVSSLHSDLIGYPVRSANAEAGFVPLASNEISNYTQGNLTYYRFLMLTLPTCSICQKCHGFGQECQVTMRGGQNAQHRLPRYE